MARGRFLRQYLGPDEKGAEAFARLADLTVEPRLHRDFSIQRTGAIEVGVCLTQRKCPPAARKSAYAAASPWRSGVFARHPSPASFDTSSSFCGAPSGRDVSNTNSPR